MSKSQIFLWLCLAFLVGVFVESLANFPRLFWLGILILGVIILALKWGNKKLMVAAAILIIFSSGGLRLIIYEQNNFSEISRFNNQGRLEFSGVLIAEPDGRTDKVYLKIKAQEVEIMGKKSETSGYVLVSVAKYPAYSYGDYLRFTGYLKTPEKIDEFDYPQFLAKDNVYSLMSFPEVSVLGQNRGNFLKEKLFWLKGVFKNSLEKNLAEPQSSFLAGLLLGEKRNLPADFSDALSLTGTTHLVALSGYNITIISSGLLGLLNFFLVRRSISFWISFLAIALFVILTGAAASAVRAAIMGILVLIAQQSGRLYSGRNALIFAGAAMVWFSPKILTFDLGFQLSFLATLGLVYLAPVFQKWFGAKEKGISKNLKEILAQTLSAQIMVLPLLLANFGRVSLIAPLANVLILLFIPATMLFGFLAGLAGIFLNFLGKILALVAWLLLTYEIKVIEFLAPVPLAAVNLKLGWIFGAAYYLIMFFIVRKFQKNNVVRAVKR